METTYTMIGVDGLQYGPITLEQLKSWINEGRVTPETKILRSDTNSWLPASNYGELGLETAVAPAPPPARASGAPIQMNAMRGDAALVRRVHGAASWFFFIAAFSVINVVLMSSNQGAFFLVGLGVNLMVHNLALNSVIAGVFALFGVFARQGHSWAFIVGMVLYFLDALLFLQVSLWLPLAFHAYALFRIGLGLKANQILKSQFRS